MAKKSKRRSAAPASTAGDDDEIADARFAAAATRPQFARPRSGAAGPDDDGGTLVAGNSQSSSGLGASLTQAIASDDRFKAALDEDRFGVVPGRDKYGRKARKKRSKDKEEEGDFDDGDADEVADSNNTKSDERSKRDDESDDEEEDQSMEARIAYLNALSRGDISASSSDDSLDDSDDDSHSDDGSSASSTNVHGKSGIFGGIALPGDIESEEEELTDEPSPYLCLLNLHWEHTRAVDAYAMLHSFCPPGTLRSVEVYPSDFGRERMEREKVEGPAGLWKRGKEAGEEDGSEKSSDGSSEGSDAEDVQHDDELDEGSDNSDASDDDEEDALNLADATAKLYAHFPAQSTVTKNSQLQTEEEEEEGFDLEKLREYEASKLRYYFAVATFSSAAAAAAVYEHVDGMEMEHSAAEIDVRVLPKDQYQSTVEGRKLRDKCDKLPAKYAPPEDNVASALRQSRVTCSWERGDAERERKLTRYGMGKEAWEAMAEGDDIKLFLATSDHSSGEEESSSEEEAGGGGKPDGKAKKKKGAGMRALLGLAASDSEEEQEISEDSSGGSDSDEEELAQQEKSKPSSTESESESESDVDENEEANATTQQATFTPGKRDLEQKIRSKLHAKQATAEGAGDAGDGEELTPYQKYLEKRKQKRRERRQAARGRKKGDDGAEAKGGGDDGMYEDDPEFGTARFSDEESEGGNDDVGGDGGFFLGESTTKKGGKKEKAAVEDAEAIGDGDNVASTKEELELLIAGDDDEEAQKDYDMRGLAKLARHANKKLRGKRKRQLETLAANVTGQDFRIDAADDRFAALLDGDDDRFGIDRTNPAYKETGAMRELLSEQSKRRAKKGKRKKIESAPSGEEAGNKDGGWVEKSSGAMELSSLVKSLKRKVVQ